MLRKLKQILLLVSGNDLIELLKDLLTKEERELLTPPKYKQALKNFVSILF
jgi:hypothetical protein